MNQIFKEILEIPEIRSAQGKISELDRLIENTRRFSLRAGAHIKILTDLVNGLIDSEDRLDLNQSALKLPRTTKSRTPRKNSEKNEIGSYGRSFTSDDGQTRMIEQEIVRTQTLLESYLERGKENSDFLKVFFEKILNSLSNQNGSVSHSMLLEDEAKDASIDCRREKGLVDADLRSIGLSEIKEQMTFQKEQVRGEYRSFSFSIPNSSLKQPLFIPDHEHTSSLNQNSGQEVAKDVSKSISQPDELLKDNHTNRRNHDIFDLLVEKQNAKIFELENELRSSSNAASLLRSQIEEIKKEKTCLMNSIQNSTNFPRVLIESQRKTNSLRNTPVKKRMIGVLDKLDSCYEYFGSPEQMNKKPVKRKSFR